MKKTQQKEKMSKEAAMKVVQEEEQRITNEFVTKLQALQKEYKRQLVPYAFVEQDGRLGGRFTIVPIPEKE